MKLVRICHSSISTWSGYVIPPHPPGPDMPFLHTHLVRICHSSTPKWSGYAIPQDPPVNLYVPSYPVTFRIFPATTGFYQVFFKLNWTPDRFLTSINALLMMNDPISHTLRPAIPIYFKYIYF